jgi:hypothetical protein
VSQSAHQQLGPGKTMPQCGFKLGQNSFQVRPIRLLCSRKKYRRDSRLPPDSFPSLYLDVSQQAEDYATTSY